MSSFVPHLAELAPGADDVPRSYRTRRTTGDRIFRGLATACALVSLVIVGTALIFLVKEARPALSSSGLWHFFTSSSWSPGTGHFGVFGVLMGTVILATTALTVGFPLAIAMALFINEYAPSRMRTALTSVIDLLAAVPSLLFGMWGFYAFQARLVPVARWMSEHLAALPFFRVPNTTATLTQSSFVAGVVIGIMTIPIITSVSRDVMAQAPREQCEGALALGGTRWGMIRTVILPFGRSGIIGATLLGFGRALGETITAAIILSIVFKVNWHVLLIGGGSVPALIATKFGEASELERSALVASGLALFILTLGVNLAARRVVDRKAVGR